MALRPGPAARGQLPARRGPGAGDPRLPAGGGRPALAPALCRPVRAALAAAGAVLGRPVGATVLPTAALRIGGRVVPLLRELSYVAHQWDRPWIVDGSAYEREFGPLPVTPLPDAVAATVSWWTTSSR